MENLPKELVGVNLLRWLVTYPVDKVIRSLNNWGLISFCKKDQKMISMAAISWWTDG